MTRSQSTSSDSRSGAERNGEGVSGQSGKSGKKGGERDLVQSPLRCSFPAVGRGDSSDLIFYVPLGHSGLLPLSERLELDRVDIGVVTTIAYWSPTFPRRDIPDGR